ncbi:MAG: hypothetical protein ISS15_02775 [Alphaproteobacteria bacterium]|nr:hypothetical protein [Alphaproteobacteria bacterium]MBL7096558.1 hypothetical protein [Alphaproteobacteria bacterium]
MYNYRVSGLSVISEMELPGAIGIANGDAPDVTVRFGRVPQQLSAPSASGPAWQREGDTILLCVPRLARFLITGGKSIVVELEDAATARDASGFVLGSSLGILLHQRGALVLHGAAVARDGRGIVICGHSGAGKSTLAAALCRIGCSFVTDDICAVSMNTSHEPIVLPDGRQLKLWEQSIRSLELGHRQGDAVRETFEKYFVAPDITVSEPPRLSAIYLLSESQPPFAEGIEALALPDAVRMLEHEAYRPGLRRQLNSTSQMLAQVAATLRYVRVFRLTRPLGFERIAATVDAVMQHWQEL